MSYELMQHRISVGVVGHDFDDLKSMIAEMGEGTLLPLEIHEMRTGLNLPIKHLFYLKALSYASSDTALKQFVKQLSIPIDMPGHLNNLVLPEDYFDKMGYAANDKGYYERGKLTLDRTLAAVERVEREAKTRRTVVIKNICEHMSPETFFAALTVQDPCITLFDVLAKEKSAARREELTNTLMTRMAFVIRKPEHLKYASVQMIVERAGLLSPSNPGRFLFWRALFEQLHAQPWVSPVADMFLSYLLDEASVTHATDCAEVITCLFAGKALTSRHDQGALVFLERLHKSKMSHVQDNPIFQAYFVARHSECMAKDRLGAFPARTREWAERFSQ
ncbi:hypothetical protein [Pseudomonas amygdali]|uniref:Uncharacterized protein n=2 Tax=Pseudomonas amygdali pv. lachrymans TaxID=53707 RepID=A0ABR5KSE5_PSEAV|nr:hypothetical protein [Pseudomonas amygdali]AXH59915.1 hypothetical protein PLA107_032335 [Pseudomonas amygdali pv. lachrymans str. M301315]KPC17324.1 Uncharacterized protein AC499_0526 [Pseudomonas amygdali pv. lachrymans]